MNSLRPVPVTNQARGRQEGDSGLADTEVGFTEGVGWGAEDAPQLLRCGITVGSGSGGPLRGLGAAGVSGPRSPGRGTAHDKTTPLAFRLGDWHPHPPPGPSHPQPAYLPHLKPV